MKKVVLVLQKFQFRQKLRHPGVVHQRRTLSSTPTTPGGGGTGKPPDLQTPHPNDCDIVRGPSLLRTSMSRPQPSLLFLPGLRSLPFWTQPSFDDEDGGATNRIAFQDPTVSHAVELLQSHYTTIRNEYEGTAHKLWSDYQTDTEHHTLHQGKWDWHSYMTKGRLQATFATHFPETSLVLQQLRDADLLFEGVPFGYAFFSTLHATSRIARHTAPTNLRLRVHLPLVVPGGSTSSGVDQVGLQVGAHRRQWVEGQALVLDDAYPHHVWNESTEARVILLVDIWHPDVSRGERQEIVQLFQHAADQGWWSPSQ